MQVYPTTLRKKKVFLVLLFLSILPMCVRACSMWKSEDNFQVNSLPPPCGDQTQVTEFGRKHLYLLNHLAGRENHFQKQVFVRNAGSPDLILSVSRKCFLSHPLSSYWTDKWMINNLERKLEPLAPFTCQLLLCKIVIQRVQTLSSRWGTLAPKGGGEKPKGGGRGPQKHRQRVLKPRSRQGGHSLPEVPAAAACHSECAQLSPGEAETGGCQGLLSQPA